MESAWFHVLSIFGVYFVPFSSLLPYFHWSTVSHVRLGRLPRRNWDTHLSFKTLKFIRGFEIYWNFKDLNLAKLYMQIYPFKWELVTCTLSIRIKCRELRAIATSIIRQEHRAVWFSLKNFKFYATIRRRQTLRKRSLRFPPTISCYCTLPKLRSMCHENEKGISDEEKNKM